MDAQVFWDGLGTWSCYHGVTTVVMGNCGFTLAPASAAQAPLVVRNLERAEDISGDAMAAGIEWGWTTFAEFLDVLDALPKGIDYAAQIGHSALRTYVMGERAFTDAATADDQAAMEAELRAALRAGAYGFTTSRTRNHMTSDGRPVASRIASLDELTRLVEVVGEEGVGTFQMVQDPPAPDEAEARDRWMLELAVRTGVPFAGTAMGNATGRASVRAMEAIAAAGGRVFGLTHPRGIGAMSSFRSQLPFDQVPEWQALRRLPEDEQKRQLRDPEVRQRLVKAAHEFAYDERLGGEARPANFELLRVLDSPVPPNPLVVEVAAARGVDPVEAMIDLALEHDFDVFFWQPFSPFDHASTLEMMRHPRTVIGFSDAGAHVSQMTDCSIYTHVLAHWVRGRQDLTLEEAIAKITFLPARAWGFSDRGLVREGLKADLNVFDPATVAPAMPTLVHDLPAGAPRIRQLSQGFRATVVGGQVTIREGEHTGATPGQLVRNALARR
jgi:N-acyl-D-aspartate/D-glutamate deacylase